MARGYLEKIKPVNEDHRLLLKLMITTRVSQKTIAEKTGVSKGNVSRYVHEGFGNPFWEKLEKSFGSEIESIIKLEKAEAEKARKKAERDEAKKREEYSYNTWHEKQKVKWEEQDKHNTKTDALIAQLLTRVESLEEQLKNRDKPPGTDDIPDSDSIQDE